MDLGLVMSIFASCLLVRGFINERAACLPRNRILARYLLAACVHVVFCWWLWGGPCERKTVTAFLVEMALIKPLNSKPDAKIDMLSPRSTVNMMERM